MDEAQRPWLTEEDPTETGHHEDGEVVDGLVVIAAEPPAVTGAGTLARSVGAVIPAVQAAAVAAGGFVAGAAVVGLVHRRQRNTPALAKGRRGGRSVGRGARNQPAELVQIVSSTRLLVDVHVLGLPNRDR